MLPDHVRNIPLNSLLDSTWMTITIKHEGKNGPQKLDIKNENEKTLKALK